MAILNFNRKLAVLGAAALLYGWTALSMALGPPGGGRGGPAQLSFRPPPGSVSLRGRLIAVDDRPGVLALKIETPDGRQPQISALRGPKPDAGTSEREGTAQAAGQLPDDIELDVLQAIEHPGGMPELELRGGAHMARLPGQGKEILTRRYLIAVLPNEIRLLPRAGAERRQGRRGERMHERREERRPEGPGGPPDGDFEDRPPPR